MLIQANAFDLPYQAGYFHSCVTSPPYFGLRRYSGEQGDIPLGLEKTPEAYICRMVEIFREVRRVLRDDGVLWLNLGDAFAEGDLLMMPHRVAIALQDDGWIVRNDNVWWKRNPMPESLAGWRWERTRREIKRIKGGAKQVTNEGSQPFMGGKDTVEWTYDSEYVLKRSSWRHTRSHEFVFQLVKGMGYYCNQEEVREAYTAPLDRWGGDVKEKDDIDGHMRTDLGRARDIRPNKTGRNPRTVMDVPTTSYAGSHYATFPPKLIAPLIRASVPKHCCETCGQAYAPVVEEHRVTGYRSTCNHAGFPVAGRVLDIFGGSGTTGLVAKELLRDWVVQDISRPYLDKQAKIRTGSGSPSDQFKNLPLFEDK